MVLFSGVASMIVPASIFLDFNLPNATTWCYLSLLLAVALFFKFTRLLSVRNWDVLTLFLLVPGLLLLQEANSPGLKTPKTVPPDDFDLATSGLKIEQEPRAEGRIADAPVKGALRSDSPA